MAILAAAPVDIAGIAAFNPARLCNGFGGNRIKRKTCTGVQIHAVALIPILKLHALQIRIRNARNHRVRYSVNSVRRAGVVTAKVRMQTARAAVVDERNVVGRISIHRPTTDITIPPVIGRKKRQRLRQCAAANGTHRPRWNRRSGLKCQQGHECDQRRQSLGQTTKITSNHALLPG